MNRWCILILVAFVSMMAGRALAVGWMPLSAPPLPSRNNYEKAIPFGAIADVIGDDDTTSKAYLVMRTNNGFVTIHTVSQSKCLEISKKITDETHKSSAYTDWSIHASWCF